jgi:hypothetical protein
MLNKWKNNTKRNWKIECADVTVSKTNSAMGNDYVGSPTP